MIYNTDKWLEPYSEAIDSRHARILTEKARLFGSGGVSHAVNNHLYYPLHKEEGPSGPEWVIREWAPSASRIYLIGDFNNWKRSQAYSFTPMGNGNWELRLPQMMLQHGNLYKFFVEWQGGGAERLPAYVTRVVQDEQTKIFSAQVWDPQPFEWKNPQPEISSPLIYECHIGMSSNEEKVASFNEFREKVLPRIARLGYNTIQIMALQEHPYYGSFGYQVSNFFALSSRFGTPEEFKALVDKAHGLGLAVIMDLVHSHSVSNENEGIGRLDGNESLYFYKGVQGWHPAWKSRCFDYGKDEVKYFLLSNCKYWLEEYRLDGFRFDGVTSMLYWDHGLERVFTGYDDYFNNGVDENAVDYLAFANMLVHEVNPNAISIAEDVSGMAGLAAPFEEGGLGFDYRMSMGVADHWIKWLKEKQDEQWSMGEIWYELTNKRADERTVSYAECHDQALVGDKTLAFRLMDKEMYYGMSVDSRNLMIDRGIALHKMIRLVTLAASGGGYLNFMGNEFGHPEWIDFPREGNGWSYKYARRQWNLADDPALRYSQLEAFDSAMIHFWTRSGSTEIPELLYIHEDRQVLIFRRKNCIFTFNFSPCGSYENLRFKARDGRYRMVLNTDARQFGGFGRLKEGEEHFTLNGELALYVPSRCAMVLEFQQEQTAGTEKKK